MQEISFEEIREYLMQDDAVRPNQNPNNVKNYIDKIYSQ